MAAIGLAILGLTGVGLVFSVIELGLTAKRVADLDALNDYAGGRVFGYLQARADFLLFASIWTILVTAALLTFGSVFRSRGETTPSRPWLAPVTIALNAVTMIFWLAGFAAWADAFIDFPGLLGAILAFAILLWLIFLALLILNILTAVAVLQTDHPGYGGMSRKSTLP